MGPFQIAKIRRLERWRFIGFGSPHFLNRRSPPKTRSPHFGNWPMKISPNSLEIYFHFDLKKILGVDLKTHGPGTLRTSPSVIFAENFSDQLDIHTNPRQRSVVFMICSMSNTIRLSSIRNIPSIHRKWVIILFFREFVFLKKKEIMSAVSLLPVR